MDNFEHVKQCKNAGLLHLERKHNLFLDLYHVYVQSPSSDGIYPPFSHDNITYGDILQPVTGGL